LGKATISMQTDSRSRGQSESYSQNNQRLGRELMTPSELATMYIISMTLMSSTSAPRTLPVGLLNLMQAQQSAAQNGTMYAGLVLVMLPTLILYICVQKQLTQGMTVGGLKG
ncbi:TraM recognition domain-containing protein, partial [Faecalibacterium sp. DFI.5.82]|uniref:TraM recognition domain-containing protein n=1 Tax=Faecalibacterium sp. DFI.5.82 TaxID=3031725 RepID=UPI0023B18CB4